MKVRNKVDPTLSIHPADFSRLGEQAVEVAAAADYVHVDVMDGRFVPDITVVAPVVKAFRSWTELPLDVHLMMGDPYESNSPFH